MEGLEKYNSGDKKLTKGEKEAFRSYMSDQECLIKSSRKSKIVHAALKQYLKELNDENHSCTANLQYEMDDGLRVSAKKDEYKYFGYTEDEIQQLEGLAFLFSYLILFQGLTGSGKR